MSLKAAAVVAFGVGGVGSRVVEALAGCSVGRLILVDNDAVSLINVNRQSIAMHSIIGWPKIQVMREKITGLSSDIRMITSERFVLPQDLNTLFEIIKSQMESSNRVSYILNAIDTVIAELTLVPYARENGIPTISSMGTGNELHPELFSISDVSQTSICPPYRVMRKELKARNISHLKVCQSPKPSLTSGPAEKDTENRRATSGSISFVPPVAGLLTAGQIIKDIYGLG